MNIALIGSGKMGRMLESLCEKDDGLHVAGFVGRTGYASLADMEQVDAALDFSYPGNLESLLACAVAKKIPLVIGTTGLSKEQGEAIRKASREIPIVWADNFSTGVTVLAGWRGWRRSRWAMILISKSSKRITGRKRMRRAERRNSCWLIWTRSMSMRLFTGERGIRASAAAKSACMLCAGARLRANTACISSDRWRKSSCVIARTAEKSLRAVR